VHCAKLPRHAPLFPRTSSYIGQRFSELLLDDAAALKR
jgi:hypothetical protein